MTVKNKHLKGLSRLVTGEMFGSLVEKFQEKLQNVLGGKRANELIHSL